MHFIETKGREGAPTLVFIHGAGANHTHWGFQMRDLQDVARLVAVDLPGHGKSEPLPGESINIDAYATALEQMIAGLGAKRIVIVGHSMGGAIALTIAAKKPEWLAGLVLIGSGAKLRVTPAILEAFEVNFEYACRLVIGWSVASSCPAEIRERALADYKSCSPSVVLGDFRACDAFDVRDRLPSVTVPSLVICGAKDQLTPKKFSEYLASSLRDSALEIVPEAGHLVMIEKADVVTGAIRRFLARLGT